MEWPVNPEAYTVENPYICVLNPEEWLRGEGNARSFLLRLSDSRQCCMGQLSLRVGQTKEQILDCSAITNLWGRSVSQSFEVHPFLLEFQHKLLRMGLYEANDRPHKNHKLISDEDRVKELNELLRKSEMRFRFALPPIES